MWLCALLAVAAFHEVQPLHDFRLRYVKPSALSNVEMLIPVAIPTDQLTSGELGSDTRDEPDAQGQDSDETFSSIPSNAFTLDQNSDARHTDPLPIDTRASSLYMAHLWPRNNVKIKEESDEEEGFPSVATATQVACRELARRQKGRARDLMLYLCEELLDVLRARCNCCREEHQRHQREPAAAAPWFGPPGGRRETVNSFDSAPLKINVQV